ncbi:MAG: acetyl-CoA carboxylase biotin carboxyl carrier protein subunit, partial [Pseudomonadales bacterium]
VHRFELKLQEQIFPVAVEQLGRGSGIRYAIHALERSVHAQGRIDGNELYSDIDGYRLRAAVHEHDGIYSLYTQDSVLHFSLVVADLGEANSSATAGALTAPMNGTIVSLLVETGSAVEKDEALLVMEAMKMEHTIRAPDGGTIAEFYYQPGDLVDGGAELLRLEPTANQ